MDALKSLVQPLVGGAGGSSVIDGVKLVVLGGTVETARRVSSSAWYVSTTSLAPLRSLVVPGLTLSTVSPLPAHGSQLTPPSQHFSSRPTFLRKTILMIGLCYGSLVAQSGNAPGSLRQPLEQPPLVSQAPRLPTTRLATRTMKAMRMLHPAKSRRASSSSPPRTRPTQSTTEATGCVCAVARRRMAAGVRSCQ